MARGILGVSSGRDEYPIANLRVIWGLFASDIIFGVMLHPVLIIVKLGVC